MEHKKMGRPSNNPRNKQITLRIAENELDLLNRLAKELKVNRIEVIIQAINLLETTISKK